MSDNPTPAATREIAIGLDIVQDAFKTIGSMLVVTNAHDLMTTAPRSHSQLGRMRRLMVKTLNDRNIRALKGAPNLLTTTEEN